MENIPVEVARTQGATTVIAVDMSAGSGVDEDLTLPWELADRVTTIMHMERNAQSPQGGEPGDHARVGTHRSSDFSGVTALIRPATTRRKAQMPRCAR